MDTHHTNRPNAHKQGDGSPPEAWCLPVISLASLRSVVHHQLALLLYDELHLNDYLLDLFVYCYCCCCCCLQAVRAPTAVRERNELKN